MSLMKSILMIGVSVVSISMAVAEAAVVSDPAAAEVAAGATTEAAMEAADEAERAAEVAVEAAALAEQALGANPAWQGLRVYSLRGPGRLPHRSGPAGVHQ